MAKTFTLEELKQFNGQNGQPAYVAVDGVVYDVSNVGPWLVASTTATPLVATCQKPLPIHHTARQY